MNIFKTKRGPRKLSFHEMHELWLLLSIYRGDTVLAVCKEVQQVEEMFTRVCKIVYGRNIATGSPSIDTAVLLKGLEMVGYPEYGEAMNGTY